MSWTGHIADQEAARLSSNSAYAAKNILGLVDGDLTTVATAQAACAVDEATKQIGDRIFSTQCQRGFKIASNFNGTFGSTFTALYASLPDNGSRSRRMICL